MLGTAEKMRRSIRTTQPLLMVKVKKLILKQELAKFVRKLKQQHRITIKKNFRKDWLSYLEELQYLYVGAPTEVEMKEKKDRVEDALAATRAAVEEGIVAGGGVALLRAIESLDKIKGLNEDEVTGIAIVKRAAEEPLRQIIANAGGEGAVIVQEVKAGKERFWIQCKNREI